MDEHCKAYLGDGVCNDIFNIPDYVFDGGDCCAATCDYPHCGSGAIQKVFNTSVTSGSGFPKCNDPQMLPITIHLNHVYVQTSSFGAPHDAPQSESLPIDPLLILDCDGLNILMANIDESMKYQSETVWIADGADCTMIVKNSTSGDLDISFVDYTIYHGDEESMATDPILVLQADSGQTEVTDFHRIEDCFLRKLRPYINTKTIYTGTGPSNKAVDWLMKDVQGYSNCQDKGFIDRYALAAINFAAPIMDTNLIDDTEPSGLWINPERQCVWRNVACVNNSVTELDLGALSNIVLSGTIASEIGLLKSLVSLDMSYNELYGNIPYEIGEWKHLTRFNVGNNSLTGPLPTELGEMTNLERLFLFENQFNGSIPIEITKMSSLQDLRLYVNALTGVIPPEIGEIPSLGSFIVDGNLLTSTIPSTFGTLKNLTYFGMSFNQVEGTIPTEFAELPVLDSLVLDHNKLTGSIPTELLRSNITTFTFYGNELSDLTPVDGQEICSAEGGEFYCDCASDCTFRPNQCACDEARACCSSFLAQFIPCEICLSGELINPDKYIRDFDTTCSGAMMYVRMSLLDFGTDDRCNQAKGYLKYYGCICSGEQYDDDSAYSVDVDSVGI